MRPFPTELGQFPLRRGRDVEKTRRNYCVFPRRLAISLSACCNRNALRVFPRGHQVDGLPRASSIIFMIDVKLSMHMCYESEEAIHANIE